MPPVSNRPPKGRAETPLALPWGTLNRMAILTILEYPDPRLRKIAAPVAAATPEIQKLVRDMADTMYMAPGIGLAATQVDVHKRIIVMDVSEARDELRVFINPEILEA